MSTKKFKILIIGEIYPFYKGIFNQSRERYALVKKHSLKNSSGGKDYGINRE